MCKGSGLKQLHWWKKLCIVGSVAELAAAVGTAQQLLQKGIYALVNKTDNYSIQATQKLQDMLAELEQKREDTNKAKQEAVINKEKETELGDIFGQKKKW